MRRTFGRGSGSAAAARAFVAESVSGYCSEEVLDAVVLLTSEVVSNALLHTTSEPVIEVTRGLGTVRVSVEDGSPVLPVQKRYGLEATTGRGLLLVETLALRWGAELVDDGKCVWFEVRLDRVGPERYGARDELGAALQERDLDLADLDALAAAFGEGDVDFGDRGSPPWRQVLERVLVR